MKKFAICSASDTSCVGG